MGPYAASNPFRFATKYTDIETGLVQYNTRYYSPSLGRFINRDSIGEAGGLNLYAYVSNRVPNSFDYLGRNPILLRAAAGALINSGLEFGFTLYYSQGTWSSRFKEATFAGVGGAVSGGIQGAVSGVPGVSLGTKVLFGFDGAAIGETISQGLNTMFNDGQMDHRKLAAAGALGALGSVTEHAVQGAIKKAIDEGASGAWGASAKESVDDLVAAGIDPRASSSFVVQTSVATASAAAMRTDAFDAPAASDSFNQFGYNNPTLFNSAGSAAVPLTGGWYSNQPVIMEPFVVTEKAPPDVNVQPRITEPNGTTRQPSSVGSGQSGGHRSGHAGRAMGSGTVITDPEAIADALSGLGSDPTLEAMEQKRRIEEGQQR